MKIMKNYHELSLKFDALLLADMFDKNRNKNFKSLKVMVYA